MEIDNIIKTIKGTTNEILIVVNKDTINHILDDINDSSISSITSNTSIRTNVKHIHTIHRDGVDVHFIDINNINIQKWIKES